MSHRQFQRIVPEGLDGQGEEFIEGRLRRIVVRRHRPLGDESWRRRPARRGDWR